MESWAALADHQLIIQVLNGHTDAYGELVRRYQAAVYGAAYRLVGNQQDALDLAQEAFVRAYSALGSFDTARPLGPWLNRIAVNTALNWLQRRRVPTVPLAHPSVSAPNARVEWQLADDSAEPERAYLAAEQQKQLRLAILALPPHYRAALELRHFQELSYEEIAEALGISLSDVKSHLFRARRMLRERLEGSL